MEFEDDIAALESGCQRVNRVAHAINARLFADERGWLDDEGRRELERYEAEFAQLSASIDAIWSRLLKEYPRQWNAYLCEMYDRLTGLASLAASGEAVVAKSRFDSAPIDDLVATLKQLIEQGELGGLGGWTTLGGGPSASAPNCSSGKTSVGSVAASRGRAQLLAPGFNGVNKQGLIPSSAYHGAVPEF